MHHRVTLVSYRQARRTFAPLSRTFAMIPAQEARDLLNREAAQEHVAQLFQVRLGPVASSLRV